jgi:hypothetical protein
MLKHHILLFIAFAELVRAAPAVQSQINIPFSFERDLGASSPRFVARGNGYFVSLEPGKVTLGAKQAAISMTFSGARAVKPVAGPELPGKVNRIRGKNPAEWELGLATYEEVRYQGIYPGVDAVYYGHNSELEFDLAVAPGADASKIRLKFEGARNIKIDAGGALILESATGAFKLPLPRIYQTDRGSKTGVAGHYKVHSHNEVAFELASYDHKKALVIDPSISFVSILGGGSSQILAISLDSSGNIYLAGRTYYNDFPTTAGVAQPSLFAGWDGIVAKLSASGSVIWATYLGGSADDYLTSIAVDSSGAAWVGGYTYSSDFPVLNAYQATFGGGSNYDAVLAKLGPTGALQYGTFLGSANSSGAGVAVDPSNNVYFTGYANANLFTTTAGALYPASSGGTSPRGFLMKFNSSGANQYSTLLGGTSNGFDNAEAVTVDPSGNAYVTGVTSSTSFVGAPGGGAQTSPGSGFVVKVNPTGSALVYFTFLGGGGTAVQIDANSPPNAYIAGNATGGMQTTAGVVQPNNQGGLDAFVAKLNGMGTAFNYVTYLGGARNDGATALTVEPSSGDVYVGGYTQSLNFPRVSPVMTGPANANSLFETTNSGATWSAVDNALPAAAAAISPDPFNTGTWVAATAGGFYKTTNGGSSWTMSSPGSATSMSRSPVNSSILYGAASGSAFLSTDGGDTWTVKGSIGGGGFPVTIIAGPLVASTAYGFSSYSTVVKSTDSGATWTAIQIVPNDHVSALVASPSGALYAVFSSSGIYKSLDQGATWTAQNAGLPPANFLASTPSLVFNPISVSYTGSADILYLATNGQVYKSTNGAVTWSAAPGAVPYASSIAVSPTNPNEVYATSGYPILYISTNGGTAWAAAGQNLGALSVNGIVFDPTNANGAFAILQQNGYAQGFVAKLSANANSLIYSTYIASDYGVAVNAVATNGLGLVYAAGETGGVLPVASVNPASPFPGVFGSGSVVAISDSTPACSITLTPAQTLVDSLSFSQVAEFGVYAASGCSWTASSNQGWAQVVSPGSGTGAGLVHVLVSQNSTGAVRTATITVNSSTASLEQTFTSCAYSLSPGNLAMGSAGGSGQITMTASNGCPWSVTNYDPALITITSASSGTGNGTISFTVSPNYGLNARTLSLGAGDSSSYVAQSGSCTFQLGSTNATISAAGGQGTVTVTASGSQCTWSAFTTALWTRVEFPNANPVIGSGTATYQVFGNTGAPRSATVTIAGNTFTVNQLSAIPEPAQVSPGSGTGSSQTFSFNFADPNGYADLSVLDVLINNYLDGQSACYVAYVPTSPTDGYLYLVDDAGDGGYVGPPILLSSGGMLQNSQCSINASSSSASASGDNLTLNLAINFKTAFAGHRIFYTAARSNTQNSGWQALGTWSVPGPAVSGPGVGGVSPGRSSTTSGAFTFTFTDTNGWQDLAVLDVLANSYIDGIHACYFAYVPTSATDGYVYLVDDAGDGNYVSGSPMLLSSGGSLSNNQCALIMAGSSASASGNTLALTMNIQLSVFYGNQIFYMAARNNGSGNSGWQAGGTVTVP